MSFTYLSRGDWHTLASCDHQPSGTADFCTSHRQHQNSGTTFEAIDVDDAVFDRRGDSRTERDRAKEFCAYRQEADLVHGQRPGRD